MTAARAYAASYMARNGLACELAAYIGTARQCALYLRKPEPTDDDLRLGLVRDGFTAAEINQHFDAAKMIAEGK